MIYPLQHCAAALHPSSVFIFLRALDRERSTHASVCRERLLSMRSSSSLSLSLWFCGRVWRRIRLNKLLSCAATHPPTPTDTYTSSCEGVGCDESPLARRSAPVLHHWQCSACRTILRLGFIFCVSLPSSPFLLTSPSSAVPTVYSAIHTRTRDQGSAVAARALASNEAGGKKRRRHHSAATAPRVRPACELSCVEPDHGTRRRCTSSACDGSPARTRLHREASFITRRCTSPPAFCTLCWQAAPSDPRTITLIHT